MRYALNRVALLADRHEWLPHLRSQEILARLFEANPPLLALAQLAQLDGLEEVSCQVAGARLAYQRATHDAAKYTSMACANLKLLPVS